MFIYNKTKQIAILLLNVKRFPPNCVKRTMQKKSQAKAQTTNPKIDPLSHILRMTDP